MEDGWSMLVHDLKMVRKLEKVPLIFVQNSTGFLSSMVGWCG